MSRPIKIPTPRESARINRAARADPDNPPLTAGELAQFRRMPGQRGPQKTPLKVQLSLRLDAGVVAWFRATGAGWQTRLGQVLRDYVATRGAGGK